jgi:hypothetical protein
MNYVPWLYYDFNDDGSSTQYNYHCIKKQYSAQTMEKLWNKWYIHNINPYKLSILSKTSLFDAKIENLPGIKIDEDTTTNLNKVNDFKNITVLKIFGLFFINIDINLENHKYKFIEALKKICELNKTDGLDELFNGIKKWTKNKYLLTYNKTKWIKYDISIFYTNSKKSNMNKIDEDDLIKIKLFGSALYDKFISYEKYLYLIINDKYSTIDELINKYSQWMETRKYKL